MKSMALIFANGSFYNNHSSAVREWMAKETELPCGPFLKAQIMLMEHYL